MTRLGSLVVLTDHAAEYLPPPDWQPLVRAGVVRARSERGNQQASEDALEVARRNDEEQHRVQEAMSQYLAGFRARGYAAEAAEALARKRLRHEGPSPRVWHPSDIETSVGRQSDSRKLRPPRWRENARRRSGSERLALASLRAVRAVRSSHRPARE
jgi:hypothetical protein